MDVEEYLAVVPRGRPAQSVRVASRLSTSKCPRDDDGPRSSNKRSHDVKRSDTEETISTGPLSTIDTLALALRIEVASQDTASNIDANTTSGFLPTIPSKHRDLETISAHTVAAIVSENEADTNCKVTVVDCRYPYEYDGGHIKGAVNLYTPEQIHGLLERRRTSRDTEEILVFHCEFSCQRGPALCRYLRGEDRAMNAENYPRLTYPDVYVMEGGYRHFYTSYPELCDPVRYTPMVHPGHKSELRRLRVKSKSRTAAHGSRPKFCMTPKAIRF